MSLQGVMSSEKASNSPGLSPVKGQKPSLGTHLFNYGSGKTTGKFLADGRENIIKISGFVGQKCPRVLQVTERRFRDTVSFT